MYIMYTYILVLRTQIVVHLDTTKKKKKNKATIELRIVVKMKITKIQRSQQENLA